MVLGLRWTARVLSSLYLAFFLSMIVGNLLTGEEVVAPTFSEGLGFLCAAVLFGGYILGWKREAWGGAIGLAAIVAFRVAIDAPALMLLTVAVPRFLYLASATLSRHRG